MNYDINDASIQKRFELEGIKKITDSETPDIPNGWYISVHNTYFRNVNEDKSKNPESNVDVAWNQQIYKSTTTPTTAWKPSN